MYKEIENRPIRYVYEATLSNGVTIFVRPDGTARDEKGNQYTEVNDINSDGDLVQLGWEER